MSLLDEYHEAIDMRNQTREILDDLHNDLVNAAEAKEQARASYDEAKENFRMASEEMEDLRVQVETEEEY